MHIPDGFVDAPTALGGAAVATTGVAVAVRRTRAQLAERQVPLAGLVTAYLLIAQLLVVPIGFGGGAHLEGTTLAAILVGPWVAIVCASVTLAIQAFAFADGGITALGLNVVNTAVVPAAVGWALYRTAGRRLAVPTAAGVAAAAAVMVSAAAFVGEFAVGGEGLSTAHVAWVTLGAHLPVAAAEAALTAAIVAALVKVRPDLVRPAATGEQGTDGSDGLVLTSRRGEAR